jgi:hypothetical protein
VNVEVQQTLEFEISGEEWNFMYLTIWEFIDSFDDVDPIVQTMKQTGNAAKITDTLPDHKKQSDDILVTVKVASAALIVTTSDGKKLAQFSINDIAVRVEIDGKTDALLVDGHLGSAVLRDVRTGTSSLYQTILSPLDKEREMVLWTYYARGKIPHDTMSPLEKELGDRDTLFSLQFRKVEIVAMVGFILTVKDMALLPILARLDLEAERAKVTAPKIKQPDAPKHSSMAYAH